MQNRTVWTSEGKTKQPFKSTLPPSTIGILGGGQLGRMIALEAREMGYHIVTMDPTPNSPCGQVADQQIEAPFNSVEGAQELAKYADVLTYEFENIGPEVAQQLEKNSDLPQGYQLLYTTQNRLREKEAIEQAGIQVAPYLPIHSVLDLKEGIRQLRYPAVLKTTEGGYDGKGQLVLRNAEQRSEAERLVQQAQTPLVLEQFVPYEKEISVIVARNMSGEMKTFPVAENIHVNNILHKSIVPARIEKEVENCALQIAERLAEHFQLIGLLAIEMFVLKDGCVYVNELAPRPHNSGHYTQEGCITSQFEQHVRAVCNLPLGNTALRNPTVMVNILGQHLSQVTQQMATLPSNMKVHLYGKKEAKENRKMGHINVVGKDTDEALSQIEQLHIWS